MSPDAAPLLPCRACLCLITCYSLVSSCSLCHVDLKKKKLHRVRIERGQNENRNLGDSPSDSSEKLPQKGRGEGRYICDFGAGGIHATRHLFFQMVSLVL